jgi:transcriptional regulator with XRE-family HTH domain
MPKLKKKVIRALRRRNAEPGILIGQSLRRLRELAGLTQSDLAERLQVGPASISKIEHRGDVQISSLQKYLEALGAKMRIEAALSLSWIKDLRLDGSFERELEDENQLIFPLFGDELFYPTRDIVLSRTTLTKFSKAPRPLSYAADFPRLHQAALPHTSTQRRPSKP